MKKFSPFLVLAMALFFFSGCFSVHTTLKVKPDGSGTIEESMSISKAALEMIKSFDENNDKGKKKDPEIFTEKDLRKKAQVYGKGVKFVSFEPFKNNEAEGVRAIYSFDDINNVSLATNNEAVPSAIAKGQKEGKPAQKNEAITFRFKKGDPAVLTIIIPRCESEKKKPASPEDIEKSKQKLSPEEEKRQLEMMKMFFKGFAFSVVIEPEGEIVETNADFRDGSKITLIDFNFDNILNDMDKLKQFESSKPETMSEIKAIMKDVPGLKFDTNSHVQVKFK